MKVWPISHVDSISSALSSMIEYFFISKQRKYELEFISFSTEHRYILHSR